MKLIGAILIALVSATSSAELVQNAKVQYTGLYGNGKLFIVLDKSMGACNNNTWIVIPADHPNKNSYFSMAMTSVASGKSVSAYVKCESGSGSTIFEDGSYIHINQ